MVFLKNIKQIFFVISLSSTSAISQSKENGKSIVNLPLKNFRDIGGQKNKHFILQGKIFRAAAPTSMDAWDPTILINQGFKTIVDLRLPMEIIEANQGHWPDSIDVLQHPLGSPVIALEIKKLIDNGLLTPDLAKSAMHRFIEDVIHNTGEEIISALAAIILATKNGRILIMCKAGKDRTGLLIYLLYKILKLNNADNLSEYMKSLPSGDDSLPPEIVPLAIVSNDYFYAYGKYLSRYYLSEADFLRRIPVTDDQLNAFKSLMLP